MMLGSILIWLIVLTSYINFLNSLQKGVEREGDTSLNISLSAPGSGVRVSPWIESGSGDQVGGDDEVVIEVLS